MGGQSQTVSGIFAAIGIVIALALAWGVGALQGSESVSRQQTPASYRQAAKADAERACSGRVGADVFECVYEKVEAGREQAHDEQDLSAQQRAASSALASSVVAFLTLGLSGIALWFVAGTLTATQTAVGATIDANQITRDMMELEHRPLVIFQTGHVREAPVGTLFRVTWENVGKTPARIKLATLARGHADQHRLREYLEMLRNEQAERSQQDIILLPGRTFDVGELLIRREAFGNPGFIKLLPPMREFDPIGIEGGWDVAIFLARVQYTGTLLKGGAFESEVVATVSLNADGMYETGVPASLVQLS